MSVARTSQALVLDVESCNHLVGCSGCAVDPLGDPTVALRGSHYLGAGPPVRNHVEYRVVPYQAVPARRI